MKHETYTKSWQFLREMKQIFSVDDAWMNKSRYFNAELKPDPELFVSECADEVRVLLKTASSDSERWKTERTPYLREIMNCISPDSNDEKIVFMKGTQISGTECGNNWIRYLIDTTPRLMLIVQPAIEMAKRWSKGRLTSLIQDSPNFRSKIKDQRSAILRLS
jgi:phage terminase large subunit GpA-like protein